MTVRTPDGQGIELDEAPAPDAIRSGPSDAPMDALGVRRDMVAVDDIDGRVARMRPHGAGLVGEMPHGHACRLAYIRGSQACVSALAEELLPGPPGDPPR